MALETSYLGGFALSAAGAACGLAIFASAPGLRGARRVAAH